MASIGEVRNKAGEITGYRFRSCIAREGNKTVWRSTTIKRPEGLTPKKEKKEVDRLADEWERAQKEEYSKTRSTTDRTRITFSEFVLEHWLPDHVEGGDHTACSKKFFRYTAANLVSYFGKIKLRQIDVEEIKRYTNYLKNEAVGKSGRPYSQATQKHHYDTLRNILEYAKRTKYIETYPCRELAKEDKPKKKKKKIDFLDPEQAARFVSCLDDEPLFWRCLMYLLITTGLRRGEAAALRWGDLDQNNMRLTVQRNVAFLSGEIYVGETKTGEERTVPLSAKALFMLMEFKRDQESKFRMVFPPDAYVFCNSVDPNKPIGPDAITRHVKRFAERHDLPDVSPHDLRHTAATLAREGGADIKLVQVLLGHKDPRTTMEYYAGVTEAGMRRAVEGIEQMFELAQND